MSVINNPLLLGQEGGGGYAISRSLRFNSSDSAYLSRTPASAGNRKTWTWSGWMKKTVNTTTTPPPRLFGAGAAGSAETGITLSGDSIEVYRFSGSYTFQLVTTAKFRDPSAWYHIVVAVDTTQSTGSNRVKVYVNGVEQTSFSTASYPPQNADYEVNNTGVHTLGFVNGGVSSDYFSGYLADIYFIDGQALDPSSFTETDATTGQLIPKAYTGSYGTNGFRLEFADNSSNTATTLGKDTSGNGNNWTPNNLSVTAGAGNDSLVDVPTNGSEVDTGLGNQVRGNYATWNPLANTSGTLTNGNLDLQAVYGNADTRANATIAVSSGKWYYEITLESAATNSSAGFGQNNITNAWPGNDARSYAYELDNARTANNGTLTAYGSALTSGDVFMCALDLDNNKIFFGKNGTWFNSSNPSTGASPAFTVSAGTYSPIGRPYGNLSAKFNANFGQRPFAYTAPSGFKALCTANLPAPLVTKPSTVMDVKLYTGNGSTQTISGLNTSPDLVWIKSRSGATSHGLFDVVRGANKTLYSNLTAAEDTYTNTLTSFNSDGFSLGADSWGGVNSSGSTYAAWCFDAGSSTVTNTQGSISSQVRANASAGFSIVTYTGTGANASVGHGLGVAPSLIIIKARTQAVARHWAVYHASIGATRILELSTTNAAQTVNFWQDTAPTSTVFTLSNQGDVNASTYNYVAYCFAPVAGYSSFGSYVGNGSADGPFVFTGMRPRWLLIKCTSAASTNWVLQDTTRFTYNQINAGLLANRSDSEYSSGYEVDVLSNGFKIRRAGGDTNASSATYVWAAFAESPFQYARAR